MALDRFKQWMDDKLNTIFGDEEENCAEGEALKTDETDAGETGTTNNIETGTTDKEDGEQTKDTKGLSSLLALPDFLLRKGGSTKDSDCSTDHDSGTCMSEGIHWVALVSGVNLAVT